MTITLLKIYIYQGCWCTLPRLNVSFLVAKGGFGVLGATSATCAAPTFFHSGYLDEFEKFMEISKRV